MRVLVLGGAVFAGRAVIDAAVAHGHEVVVAARGLSGRPPSGVTFISLDRSTTGALDAVPGRFDLVVDTWSGAPRVVQDGARSLADRVGCYCYISSRSVYQQPMVPFADEHAPTVDAHPSAPETNYQADKRGAELAVAEAFPAHHLLLRAGLVLGPRENVGRLPWWLRRIAAGGDVLAPGPAESAIQYIDVRDLAEFVVRMPPSGDYNVVSPAGHTTMGALLDACIEVTGSQGRLVWTAPDRILAAGISPWTQLPIWIPDDSEDYAMHQADVTKARAAGLECRPVADTVHDTWMWLLTAGPNAGVPPTDRPVGVPPELEMQVLVQRPRS
jgi:2'-hydroxyisoflavone reductase